MKRRDFLRSALSLAGIAIIGGLQGCGSAHGHESARSDADLKVVNHTNDTLHVYVDGSHVGDVDANDRTYFHIVSGTRTVEVRKHGDSVYYDLGDHYFGGSRVRLHFYG
jgi:hypothetical protein